MNGAKPRTGTGSAWLGVAFLAAGQLLLARELAACGAGETAAAAVLGAALGWAALGAALAPRLAPRAGGPGQAALLGVLPGLLAAQLWAVRGPVELAAGLSGGSLAPGTLALAAAVLTSGPGLAGGLLFPALAGTGGGPARAWPRAAGAAAAGAAALALPGLCGLDTLVTAAAISGAFVCLLSAVHAPGLTRHGQLLLAAWAAAVSAGGLGFALSSAGQEWRLAGAGRGGLVAEPGRALDERDTPRGCVVLASAAGQALNASLNGAASARQPDPLARADAIFICAQARHLRRVLVIGGGRPELVLELLARGAARAEVLSADPQTDALLAAQLPEPDRRMLRSERVCSRGGSLPRLLRETGEDCDAVVLSPPLPLTAAAGTQYTREFLAAAAGRLAERGVLVVCLPVGADAESDWQARLYATLRGLSEERRADGGRLLGLPTAFPAGTACRLAAPRGDALALTPEAAAARYATHRMPDGGEPAPAGAPDFSRLVEPAAARRVTERLAARWQALEVVGESALAPETLLDCLAEDLAGRAPASAAALRAVRRVPLAAPFAAVWLAMVVLWLAARRSPGAAPPRLVLCAGAFSSGAAGLGGLVLAAETYSAQTDALWGALPLLAGALAAGAGVAAALALRLAPVAARGPRRALATVQFGFLLLLMLGSQLPRLEPGTLWVEVAHGVGLALLGAAVGMDLTLLAALSPDRADPPGAFTTLAAWAGLGAATAAVLSVSLFLNAIGPAPAFLLLLAIKAAMLGLFTAGVGSRRPAVT